MSKEEFEQLIIEATEKLPARAKEVMRNVAFVVEENERRRHAGEKGIHGGGILLGLYEGVPLARRGAGYSGVLPDKITIFQRPIEELAGGDPGKIREIVEGTVWHEVGHHLGFSERGIRDREKTRRPTLRDEPRPFGAGKKA